MRLGCRVSVRVEGVGFRGSLKGCYQDALRITRRIRAWESEFWGRGFQAPREPNTPLLRNIP